MGRALWWLGDVDGALDHRERAYAALRKRGDNEAAARIALWVAREYSEAVGNEPASNGWIARAEGLLSDADPSPALGWLELTRGELAFGSEAIREHAQAALERARQLGDADLEASALAQLGRALIYAGEVEAGMGALDEAMTVATGGEVTDPLAFGDVCCTVTSACEEAGDMSRLMRWNQVVESYLERHQHAPLLSFCGTCCAEVFQANGEIDQAEQWLVQAMQALEGTGHRSRCVHPAAKLAELRVMLGRVEEAERLISGYEDLPDAVRASVAVHMAKRDWAIASALLLRRLNQLKEDNLLAAPLLATLVQVQIEQGGLPDAAETADRLRAVAERSSLTRVSATAELAAGRVGRAAGDPDARRHLESALDTFVRLEMPFEAARSRKELAELLQASEPDVAAREARVAVETFERLGAAREADSAAALLRELGGPARTGPKGVGLLSKREVEVLALLGEGLSNAEIAARLYISTKTAGNHVSNILAKLHLRSRAEAAAYATRYLDKSSAQE